MKMPRDGARVHRCSRKASAKRSTIKCVRHLGRKRRATNQSHNSRVLATCKAAARCLFYALLRGLAYSAACTGDNDDLVFVTSDSISIFLVTIVNSDPHSLFRIFWVNATGIGRCG